MLESKIICNEAFRIGDVDPRLYGSFLEHMGRVIYSGIYEPEHPVADEEGFRRDVLDAVREMGVSTVRYPGGNFVSSYHWEDGTGPRDQRPVRLDLAWKAIETNEFGTDEFINWCRKAGTEPIFTVNLGTRGITDAVQYLEYCNFPGGTSYSERRKKNGRNSPYGVKLWCLGNEMDGEWQIGHKTAWEYGRLAAEAGKAMKVIDPEIEVIVSGSSLSSMKTFPDWDLEVLELTYDTADYMALHQYYGGQEKGTAYFLAQTKDMEDYIRTLRSAAQIIRKKKNSPKEMKFSVDEWGVWAVPGNTVNHEIDQKPWQTAPAISEQIYTLEDALLFAGMMMVILRNCDVIRIACQSLLTNISACIMTERLGECWLQTIYYPFHYFAHHAKGVVLDSRIISPEYQADVFGSVPFLDGLIVRNEKELVVFLVNKCETEEMKVEIDLQGFCAGSVTEAVELTSEDKKQTNREDHQAVIPQKLERVWIREQGGEAEAILKPLSFAMIRIGLFADEKQL